MTACHPSPYNIHCNDPISAVSISLTEGEMNKGPHNNIEATPTNLADANIIQFHQLNSLWNNGCHNN